MLGVIFMLVEVKKEKNSIFEYCKPEDKIYVIMQIDWWKKNNQDITNQETSIEQTVNKLMIILNQKYIL